MKLGPYTIVAALRPDNPAFPKYQIFRGGKLIGTQFSVPSESDARWHEVQAGTYAKAEQSKQDPTWQLRIKSIKRGRPSNAEKAAREDEARRAMIEGEPEAID